MRRVVVLDSSVRLIVLQFLVPKELVPEVVPRKGPDKNPAVTSLPQASGIQVLPSTPGVYLLNLMDGICPITGDGAYELVDAWFVPSIQHFNKCTVRYVLCRKEHVRPDELYPTFVAKRDELFESLLNFADNNLWATQGHLNPYFENGKPTISPSEQNVLMFGCAGRQQTTDSAGNTIKVFHGGRDENNQGLGPKVTMREKAPQLKVVGDEVVLVPPEPVEVLSV